MLTLEPERLKNQPTITRERIGGDGKEDVTNLTGVLPRSEKTLQIKSDRFSPALWTFTPKAGNTSAVFEVEAHRKGL
jgi:hypothetical protein